MSDKRRCLTPLFSSGLAAMLLAWASPAASAPPTTPRLPPPAFQDLRPLPGALGEEPIIVSNNPESVSSSGILFSSNNVPTNELRDPNKFRRQLSNQTVSLDGCPTGTFKSAKLYLHHLNFISQNARFPLFQKKAGIAIVVRASQRTDVVAVGALGEGPITPSNFGSSPSYRVALAKLRQEKYGDTGSLFDEITEAHFVDVPANEWTVVTQRGWYSRSRSLDASLNISADACIALRIVALEDINDNNELRDLLTPGKLKFATGNILPPCGSSPQAWGVPAGIYRYSAWGGVTTHDINQASSITGWLWDGARVNNGTRASCARKSDDPSQDQASAAITYYNWNNSGGAGDSDFVSTANYGAEYDVEYRLRNQTNQCVTARVWFASYSGRRRPSEVTTGPGRLWDGPFYIDTFRPDVSPGIQQVLVRKIPDAGPSGPYKLLATFDRIGPGEQARIKAETYIPGLISVPGAVLIETEPCAARRVALVVDDTGSMGARIDDTQVALRNFVDAQPEGDLSWSLYTFKDDVTYLGETTSREQIKSMINQLSASGGGDCPEQSLGALRQAAERLAQQPPGGTRDIVLVTDAESQPGDQAGLVALAQQNDIRISTLLTGSCFGFSLARGGVHEVACEQEPEASERGVSLDSPLSLLQASIIVPAPVQYSQLAEQTGGQFFYIRFGTSEAYQDALRQIFQSVGGVSGGDTTPPDLFVQVTPEELWPPNHALHAISAAVSVSDDQDANPTVWLESIVSNEPDDGLGDGDTSDDIQGADLGRDDRQFQVRAERAGGGAGRVYTVTYAARDAAGNVRRASATIRVPHKP